MSVNCKRLGRSRDKIRCGVTYDNAECRGHRAHFDRLEEHTDVCWLAARTSCGPARSLHRSTRCIADARRGEPVCLHKMSKCFTNRSKTRI